MTPEQQYQQDLASDRILADPRQQQAIIALQKLFEQLRQKETFFATFFRRQSPVKGFYFYGPVGSGKTYLLDTFYHCLQLKKLRMHFYEFMQMIHCRLNDFSGKKNPLDLVADQIAEQARVICFDEFVVSNIVDAMLLGKLLTALFKRGVCLLSTSNTLPDDLYKNGLQRELFLPAIAILKDHVTVMRIDNCVDYRLRDLTAMDVYFYPLNDQSKHRMAKQFESFSQGKQYPGDEITLLGREVGLIKRSDQVIWFCFDNICRPPRSQQDYLELVRWYRCIFISKVPRINKNDSDAISLFISLVDVLYNAGIGLVISAQVPIDQIYIEGELAFDFKRTKSRLIEMQSKEYLNQIIN